MQAEKRKKNGEVRCEYLVEKQYKRTTMISQARQK